MYKLAMKLQRCLNNVRKYDLNNNFVTLAKEVWFMRNSSDEILFLQNIRNTKKFFMFIR